MHDYQDSMWWIRYAIAGVVGYFVYTQYLQPKFGNPMVTAAMATGGRVVHSLVYPPNGKSPIALELLEQKYQSYLQTHPGVSREAFIRSVGW